MVVKVLCIYGNSRFYTRSKFTQKNLDTYGIRRRSGFSNYPPKRVKEDGNGKDVGVIGNVELVQDVKLGGQPISAVDWSPDKQGLAVATGFDQTVRVIIVTKLNTL